MHAASMHGAASLQYILKDGKASFLVSYSAATHPTASMKSYGKFLPLELLSSGGGGNGSADFSSAVSLSSSSSSSSLSSASSLRSSFEKSGTFASSLSSFGATVSSAFGSFVSSTAWKVKTKRETYINLAKILLASQLHFLGYT